MFNGLRGLVFDHPESKVYKLKTIDFTLSSAGVLSVMIPVFEVHCSSMININDKIHLNPEVYKANEAYEKMYEYYKYYYDKHNV